MGRLFNWTEQSLIILVTLSDDHLIIRRTDMKKLLVGIVAGLLLASCAYTAPPQVSAQPAMNSGAGHPADDYPGPRLY
jgi:hypothetical protein